AKVILFGEHAVVHGRTAVATAIERGAEARGEPAERSRLQLEPWGRVCELGEDDDVSRAFGAVLENVGVRSPVGISVDVGVPGGAGLGCSAAIAVSIARAAAEASGLALDDDRIAECANAWEKVFHGNPSGVDVAVATRGGVITFKKGAPPKRIVPGGE